MKLGKLSLVAVMALGTSVYALENVKVNGQAKLIYQTSDVERTITEQNNGLSKTGLFEKGNLLQGLPNAPYGGAAAGGASLTFGLTADLLPNLSFGTEAQMFSTLGLENNLVSDTMAPNGANRANDAWSFSQMWLASTFGKTTFKAGRMELDTPLAFTEKWNIVKNTFEGAVVLNNDIPDTTLVAAWVGKHNGSDLLGSGGLNAGSAGRTANLDGATSGSNPYVTFGYNGAYAVAAINKSIPNTTVQGWFYNISEVADAYWLQADTKIADMISLGAQFSEIDPKGNFTGVSDSKIWAAKVGVDIAGVNLYTAYSEAQDGGVLGFANTATGDKTKIYTGDGSIYMDSIVTAPGTQATKVGAKAKVADISLSTSYCIAKDSFNVDSNEISAWDVSVGGKVGYVNLQAIYTQVYNDDAATEFGANIGVTNANFYGGRDLETLRIIATLPF